MRTNHQRGLKTESQGTSFRELSHEDLSEGVMPMWTMEERGLALQRSRAGTEAQARRTPSVCSKT